MRLKIVTLLSAISIFFVFPSMTLAIIPPETDPPGWSCEGFLDCLSHVRSPEGLRYTSEDTFIGQLISDFLPAIFSIAGIITVIMIVISGIQFMTSSGNPEAAGAARGRLVFAAIGFAVIVLSFLILKLIDQEFLGGSGIV